MSYINNNIDSFFHLFVSRFLIRFHARCTYHESRDSPGRAPYPRNYVVSIRITSTFLVTCTEGRILIFTQCLHSSRSGR